MTDDPDRLASTPPPPKPPAADPDHVPNDRDDREVPLDDPELTELPLEDDDVV